MNGLPENFDASEFAGRTLEVLVVGQFQLTLKFSDKFEINIEGQVAVNSGTPVELPDSLMAVYPLINQTVDSASANKIGTLSLTFGNGTVLDILDSESHFESYNFSMGGSELFVV